MGDGTLSLDRFRFFMQQDYLFLIDYSRAIAIACAKSPDLDSMGHWVKLLDKTLNSEMALHRSFCVDFGITEEELAATQPSPATISYTKHLVDTAYSEGIAGIAAAMLPCQWGYDDAAQHLAANLTAQEGVAARSMGGRVQLAGVSGDYGVAARFHGRACRGCVRGAAGANGGAVQGESAPRVPVLGRPDGALIDRTVYSHQDFLWPAYVGTYGNTPDLLQRNPVLGLSKYEIATSCPFSLRQRENRSRIPRPSSARSRPSVILSPKATSLS
ncbi:MAG: hypothetical protein VB860_11320 [Dehalococcoidia bacterium]